MRQIKNVVISVGVALSVTPIFHSAVAQQGAGQANLLLEVQTMRQEIAELRDMVERQQFQLKKLQQAKGSSNPALRSQGAANQQAFASQGVSVNAVPQPSYSNTEVSATSIPAGSASADNTGGNFYRPYTPDEPARADTSATTNAVPSSQPARTGQWQTNQIEERVIDAPAAQIPDAYPPVVERSINTPSKQVPITGAGTTNGAANGQAVYQEARSTQVPTTVTQAAPSTNYQAVPQSQSVPLAAPRSQGTQPNPNYVPPQNQAIAGSEVPQSVASQVPQIGNAGVVPIPSDVAAFDPAQNQVASAANSPAAAQLEAPKQIAPAALAENEYYSQGFELLKQSQYEQAASIFEQQLSAYPQGNLAGDAHYWIAEAMHVSRKLDVAKVHLKKIISDYPQSRRLPDAMLKTAYIEQTQGNQIEARILFQEIVNLHPKSDAAIAAKNQLAASN